MDELNRVQREMSGFIRILERRPSEFQILFGAIVGFLTALASMAIAKTAANTIGGSLLISSLIFHVAWNPRFDHFRIDMERAIYYLHFSIYLVTGFWCGYLLGFSLS